MGTVELDITTVDATFGAVVEGLDLRAVDAQTVDAIRRAWHEFALLIFPDQRLTNDEQDAFALHFGPLEFTCSPITNIRRNGELRSDAGDDVVKSLRGNEGWHHDSTYMPVQARGAVFRAEIIPSAGGATGFADMRAALDALDPEPEATLRTLSAHHSLEYSQGRRGLLPTRNEKGGYDVYGYHGKEPPLRPLVATHPETGREHLCIGRHAHDIVGMSAEASEALLDRLNDEACRPPRIYVHEWTVGDVVLWDNRRLMHRATPYDMTQPRRMWHTRIAGDPAVDAGLNHRTPS